MTCPSNNVSSHNVTDLHMNQIRIEDCIDEESKIGNNKSSTSVKKSPNVRSSKRAVKLSE